MKKIFYSLLAITMTMATSTLTSCEDVPAPYELPSTDNKGDDTPAVNPEGAGTKESPYNVAAVNEYIKNNTSWDNTIYIKGIVCETKEVSAQYGNATFYISEDGKASDTKFYVYRCKGLGNKKIASDDEVKVGDEVIICGKVTNYNGTFETVQNDAYIYSLNGKTESGSDTPEQPKGEAKGDGTLENPYNSVAANAYASSLEKDAVSDKEIYVKGKIVSIKSNYGTQYGNASFYISDDGTSTDQFYVFQALYLNNVKYTEGDLLNVGDEVIICGKVTNYYGNTPETAKGQSYLYSWTKNGGSTPGGDTPGGVVEGNSITLTLSSLNMKNGEALSTVTLSDGTTLTFDGGGVSNIPKYYTTGAAARVYPKNSIKVTSTKKITAIELTCVTNNGTMSNASGDISATSGTVSINDALLNVKGIDNTTVTLTNTSTISGAASQLRFSAIKITYAE